MKAIKFLSLGLLATMIASCSSEDVAMPNNEVAATLTGNIGSSLKTRAFNDQWEAGDKIGLFVFDAAFNAEGENSIYRTYDNSPFKTDNAGNYQSFTPAEGVETIMYPSTGASINFKSYYPYNDTLSLANPVVEVKWEDQSVPQKLDYLISDNPSSKMAAAGETQDPVVLTFKHNFSRMVLTIKANSAESQIQTEELEGITVSGKGLNVVTYCNVLTGEITKGDSIADAINFNVVEQITKDGEGVITSMENPIASAIVCPEYNVEGKDRIVRFTLADGRIYKWTIPSDIVFESGKSYNWNIKLKGDGLAQGELIGTIDDWTDVNLEDVDLEDPEKPNTSE